MTVKQLVHLLDRLDTLWRKATATQTFNIEAAHSQWIAFDHHVWGHILCDTAGKTRHGMRTDFDKLMQITDTTLRLWPLVLES